MMNQMEMANKYHEIFKKEGMVYEKFKPVVARPAIPGEQIITITSDGKETQNTAQEDDFVIQNQTEAKELYIISGKKFRERYKDFPEMKNAPEGFSFYLPTGKIIAIQYNDEDMEFMAPWGEAMVIKKGDMLCSTDTVEFYRIGAKEFSETYKVTDFKFQWPAEEV